MADGPQLSELQVDLMRVLWTRHEAAVADVQAELEASRGLALTTVATMLTRLEKRGLVARRKEGTRFLYRATVSEGQVRQSMVGELRDSLFQGDTASLVSHLLRESDISEGDLNKVRELIEERARRQSKGADDE